MLRRALSEAITVANATLELDGLVEEAARRMIGTLSEGGKIFACGNGGSAAEAQHFVTELVGRYRSNRRSLPAIWLGGDTGQMSCIANDFSADEVFSRPLSALAGAGDLLLVLSSSGRSNNLLQCLQLAKQLGVSSIALLGKGGGEAADLAGLPIVIASESTARVQEMHLVIVHALCDAIEVAFPG